MHADDTTYARMRNGIVVVSGTGPTIRVADNRLLIRDGPLATKPLILSRAEATRRLRHVVVIGNGGGSVTLPALQWLYDTRTAFSVLDWRGGIIVATGPRGTDRPALRRKQVLICAGAVPGAAVAIGRALLAAKVKGQAAVLSSLQPSAAAELQDRAAAIAASDDGADVLKHEARAAAAYWRCWEGVPVRFTRQIAPQFDKRGRLRPYRNEAWTVFGSRTSLLTGSQRRATTPGNAVLNWLYALLETQMTIALIGASLDPGSGIFHADVSGRSSLAFDAMECVRPAVDAWLLDWLSTVTLNDRDFDETPDGEVRLTHPLNAHLAFTASLWRKACEPVAAWLASSFDKAATGGASPGDAEGRAFPVLPVPSRQLAPASLPVQTFHTGSAVHRLSAIVPGTCPNCGKALTRRTRFCSDACAMEFHAGTVFENRVARRAARRTDPVRWEREAAARSEGASLAAAERRAWKARPGWSVEADKALLEWYRANVLPRAATLKIPDIVAATGLKHASASLVRRGYEPHPRHVGKIAALLGIEPPAAA